MIGSEYLHGMDAFSSIESSEKQYSAVQPKGNNRGKDVKKSKRSLILFWAFSILVLLTVTSMPVSAVIDWSDDFNDGNYDGWTVTRGSFTISGPPTCSLTGLTSLNEIQYPSSRSNGTWFFDLYENSTHENGLEVLFTATGNDQTEFEGYSIHVRYGGFHDITLFRWNYSDLWEASVKFPLEDYETPESYSGWFRYRITRTATGDIYVNRNGELIISSTFASNEWQFASPNNHSDKVVFRCEAGDALDNFYVGTYMETPTPSTCTGTVTTSTTTSTAITSTTTTETDTTGGMPSDPLLLVATAIGIGILIIVAVVYKIRK